MSPDESKRDQQLELLSALAAPAGVVATVRELGSTRSGNGFMSWLKPNPASQVRQQKKRGMGRPWAVPTCRQATGAQAQNKRLYLHKSFLFRFELPGVLGPRLVTAVNAFVGQPVCFTCRLTKPRLRCGRDTSCHPAVRGAVCA
jgi:hypothetical protein